MKQLQYAEDVVFKGFAGFPAQNPFNNNFLNDSRRTVQEQINYLFGIANSCRKDYKPVWSGETKYLPIKDDSGNVVKSINPVMPTESVVTIIPVSESEFKSKIELTEPPKQQTNQDDLLNAVLIGLGAIVVLKILS